MTVGVPGAAAAAAAAAAELAAVVENTLENVDAMAEPEAAEPRRATTVSLSFCSRPFIVRRRRCGVDNGPVPVERSYIRSALSDVLTGGADTEMTASDVTADQNDHTRLARASCVNIGHYIQAAYGILPLILAVRGVDRGEGGLGGGVLTPPPP